MPPRQLLLLLLVGLYFGAGKLGLEFFGLVNPSASAVWPPTGVAIAAVILLGYRVWPAVFAGAFLVNITTAGSVLTSIDIAAGNTLEAVAAAYLIGRFANGGQAFRRALDTFKFGAVVALATTLSATVGVGTLTLAGLAAPAQFGAIWLTWWLGDASGGILVSPLLILWYLDRRCRASPRRLLEALSMFATVLGVTALLFLEPRLGHYPLAFLSTPLLIWAAFRFQPREVATAVVAMSFIATWATARGQGPFAMATPNESLLVLQAFMAMIAMTALIIAALVQERAELLRRARHALGETEAALRSRDVFLAMLSHELRSPLSAISASAEVLDDAAFADAALARARRIIQRQTRLLTRLIEDLLDVGRITAGRLTLDRRRVELAEIVENSVLPFMSEGPRRAPRIELQLNPVWVDADPDRLRQIIANLLHNAIKYTPAEGHVRVHVFAAAEEAVLLVADSGPGIAAELLPRVFDLFTQGEQGLDRARDGLGIGLALVRRLAELHGGSVEAFSDGPGAGSTFVVRLPRAQAPETLEDVHGRETETRHANRVLLVEDNADARESLRDLLKSLGHEVYEAADGETGVERALAQRPDFALIDLGLPGIDGYEVARRIRAAGAPTHLIALTGYGRGEDRAHSAQSGFDAHLVKPVAVAHLQQAMDEVAAMPLAARMTPSPARPREDRVQ